MLSRLFSSGGRNALASNKSVVIKAFRCSSQVATTSTNLPAGLNLNQYPAQMEDWENYTMPNAPYEGMGPLPPLPTYDKSLLRHYMIPEYWFEFLYPRTGVTGPYTLVAALSTMLVSKELYIYGPDSWYTFYFVISVTLLNKLAGGYIRDTVEGWRVDKLIALDQVKEDEVGKLVDQLDALKLEEWRAGVQELYNEAKQSNLAMMLETAYLDRKATVVNTIKQKLDYQIAVQKVDAQLAQEHMVNWIESKVMETITPESQQLTLNACVATLNKISGAEPLPKKVPVPYHPISDIILKEED